MPTQEWTQQTEAMFKAWTDAQRKIWEKWPLGMQGAAKSPSDQVWEKSMQAWEESVKKTLEAQAELTQLWAGGSPNMSGLPKEVAEWAHEGQEMLKRWTETQTMLWEHWFHLAKQFNHPSNKLGGNWEQEGQKLLHAWQEAAKKTVDAQSEWLRDLGRRRERSGPE
jgi:hypothetical protein